MGVLVERVFDALARFNRDHPWSHNDAYIPWVLRHARAVRQGGGSRALDVGCGTGNLLKRLAGVMEEAVGIEPDPSTAAIARSNLAGAENAVVVEGPFGHYPAAGCDLVTFVAVLHHLPLAETLQKARSMVRPGGRLIVVGLSKEAADDRAWSLASMILNPIVGAIRHPRRAHAYPVNMTTPTAEACETFDEIAREMRHQLPGVKLRRSLFWRYTAVWTAPTRA
jgi:SAM-dependent methyltransferase